MLIDRDIEQIIGTGEFKINPVGGGDINDAYRIDTGKEIFFLKFNSIQRAVEMFQTEKRGLELLHKAGVLVPKPVRVFKTEGGAGLMLEWIENGKKDQSSWKIFARSLARLHKTSSDEHGLDHDNYIGRLDQKNGFCTNWSEFYRIRRIEPQIQMAIDGNLLPVRSLDLMERSFKRYDSLLDLSPPSLLHGDLWSGNLMFNTLSSPVFIDPAVYFGHREMDIAMMKFFGGFETGFKFYQESFPLDDGWEERLSFHQLYYILVHVNLIGSSYANSAMRILELYSR